MTFVVERSNLFRVFGRQTSLTSSKTCLQLLLDGTKTSTPPLYSKSAIKHIIINERLLLVTLSSSPHHMQLGCSPRLQWQSNSCPFLQSLPIAIDHFVFVVIKWRTARGTKQRLFNSKRKDRKHSSNSFAKTPEAATSAAIKSGSGKSSDAALQSSCLITQIVVLGTMTRTMM